MFLLPGKIFSHELSQQDLESDRESLSLQDIKTCEVLPDGRELFPLSVPRPSVLLPIFPCKQEAALLNIISIESKWYLCLISSGLRLYQQAHCWSCICSLEYFRALESDRFMFITLNHSIIDSSKCYFPRWQEAVGKKTQTPTPLVAKRANPAAFT